MYKLFKSTSSNQNADNKQNDECVEVILKYKSGKSKKLSYPDSQKWLDSINSAIIDDYAHGTKFPEFKWTSK